MIASSGGWVDWHNGCFAPTSSLKPELLVPLLTFSLTHTFHCTYFINHFTTPAPPPCCRFSPLWQPAAKALGEALTQNPDVTWPIIFQHLTTVQQQFLSGSSSASSDGSSSDSDSSDSSSSSAFSLQQQWESYCSHGCSSIAAAAAERQQQQQLGGCTDAANRLTNLLKGLTAQASAGVLEKTAKDWVPLLLTLAAAVTPVDLGGESTAAAAAAEEDEEGNGEAAATAAVGEEGEDPTAAAAVGEKRKVTEDLPTDSTPPQQQQQQPAKRQRGSSGLAVALNRDGLGGLGFSVRAWRGVMMEWLALLAASKAAKRLTR